VVNHFINNITLLGYTGSYLCELFMLLLIWRLEHCGFATTLFLNLCPWKTLVEK